MILGGYGVFGGRLAILLSDLPMLELLICGRNLANAQAFCRSAQGKARLTPVQLDRRTVAEHLNTLTPDIVVDASGPFQEYGAQRYAVVQACIDARISYLDFADAADFVFGITQFDAAAKEAGIFVLSGVSSFPVLTAAVLREMAKDMQITSVRGGIAPSPFAGVGLNVIRAVTGYAGGLVKLRRNGVPAGAYGIAETMRYTIAVPGKMPLRNLLFSLVDVPDLQVIPPEHPTMRSIWMGAGPVPEILHRILILLARTRVLLHLPPLTPLAPIFYRVLNLMKFGEHRGGMFVQANGLRDGQPIERSWHLLAEGDDGPFIPSMAIETILRKTLEGEAPASGARPATHALNLADYDALFASRTIYTGFRGADDGQAPLYQRVLGPVFDTLPPQVRALHRLSRPQVWSGMAETHQGTNPIARAIAHLIGFPATAAEIPVSVAMIPQAGREIWTRTFGTKSFTSIQSLGRARDAYLIVERFGLLAFALALVADGEHLILRPRRWTFLGIPMPRALLPSGDSFETEEGGRFRFNVTIKVPLIGLIVAYRGWLELRG